MSGEQAAAELLVACPVRGCRRRRVPEMPMCDPCWARVPGRLQAALLTALAAFLDAGTDEARRLSYDVFRAARDQCVAAVAR